MNSTSFFCGKKVLVLAAHTDDEFGCAGAIAKAVRCGAQVHYVAFSRCEPSVPVGFPSDVLENECRNCLAELGVAKERIEIFGFPVRYFPSHRQDILEKMVSLNRVIEPDVVLLPNSNDTHQDHSVISQEGFRAFKRATVLGYELPQNNNITVTSCFVRLDPCDLSKKTLALQSYKSQGNRTYASDEFITSLAIVRGVQAGSKYAEAFEPLRVYI